MNACTEEGKTALHLAAEYNNLKVAQLLLGAGAGKQHKTFTLTTRLWVFLNSWLCTEYHLVRSFEFAMISLILTHSHLIKVWCMDDVKSLNLWEDWEQKSLRTEHILVVYILSSLYLKANSQLACMSKHMQLNVLYDVNTFLTFLLFSCSVSF